MKYLYEISGLTYSQIRKVEITKETPKFYFVGMVKIPKEKMRVRHSSYNSTYYYTEEDQEIIEKYKAQQLKNRYRLKISELGRVENAEDKLKILEALKNAGF